MDNLVNNSVSGSHLDKTSEAKDFLLRQYPLIETFQDQRLTTILDKKKSEHLDSKMNKEVKYCDERKLRSVSL